MSTTVPSAIRLPQPEALYSSPFQSGITDPIWPDTRPDTDQMAALREDLKARMKEKRIGRMPAKSLSDAALAERYESEYAGRVSRQKFMSIMRADVLAETREDLVDVLKVLTEFSVEQMTKLPSQEHVKLLEDIPDSYRVTVTVGFGASLFVDKTGFDRFGLRGRRPKFLKPMPSFPGDSAAFDPGASASDLIILVSSDHPYINVAVVRYFAEFFNKRFLERHPEWAGRGKVLEFGPIEEGFSRKDKREFLKFDDGIDNINMSRDDLERLVYVADTDHEPDWCLNGSYLVYRKVRENMPKWEALTHKTQGDMIGRVKETGKPLSRKSTGPEGLVPIFPDPLDPKDGPLNSHVRKVQPRRPTKDLFGIDDKERRFLRRPYPFFSGLDEAGNSVNGLQFVAFMKSIQQQFEHVVNMWQMNPDFPTKGTGMDALFAHDILSTIDGGYYFCPPGLTGKRDFFGSGMFGD